VRVQPPPEREDVPVQRRPRGDRIRRFYRKGRVESTVCLRKCSCECGAQEKFNDEGVTSHDVPPPPGWEEFARKHVEVVIKVRGSVRRWAGGMLETLRLLALSCICSSCAMCANLFCAGPENADGAQKECPGDDLGVGYAAAGMPGCTVPVVLQTQEPRPQGRQAER
jgi:hypothetical protein